MSVDLNFMVGGEAGQGVQTVGLLLAKAFSRSGYYVFADQDYESRVRGGHNFFRIRVKDAPVGAIAPTVDVLLALNRESIELHDGELSPGGLAVYDGEKLGDVKGKSLFSVPMERLAEESAGQAVMSNTVALGAALGLVNGDLATAFSLLREFFPGDAGEANVKAAQAGYDYVRQNFRGDFGQRLEHRDNGNMMLLTGNDAIAVGAIAAGCRFMAAYPMTPASSIMEYMAEKSKDHHLVMVHAEDEIAAANMIIGAAYAGTRAMTATSGSGFCLMAEALSLAGITETPVVMINAQRPGPATGLPTRTEQSDLEFVLHTAHGEFPRAILAPATIEDCFWLTVKAFNLAEKYQTPVIILTDHHLASSYQTVKKFDLSGVTIDRGLLLKEGEAGENYMRHRITESGVSPRLLPGSKEGLTSTDADEHNEAGHLIEDAETRTAMVQKRLRKLYGLKKEIAPPRRHGAKKADMTLIGWGSTYGSLVEAADLLRGEGLDINLLHLSELYPFPAESVTDALNNCKQSYTVEGNATAQLARLIRAETGLSVSGSILKYDGRPFTPQIIVERVKKEAC